MSLTFFVEEYLALSVVSGPAIGKATLMALFGVSLLLDQLVQGQTYLSERRKASSNLIVNKTDRKMGMKCNTTRLR